MREQTGMRPPMRLFDRLPTAWVFLVCALLVVLTVFFLAAAPISWLYGNWAPARDFHDATLERIVADLETTRVLPKGTKWLSDDLKYRHVTLRYSWYHEPATVLDLVAKAAGVTMEVPADYGCSICGVHVKGPAFVRFAAGEGPGARWVRASNSTVAVDVEQGVPSGTVATAS